MDEKQRYELEYSEDEPKQPKEGTVAIERQEGEEPLGDVYDVYGMVSNVHSKTTDMTRDYVLAQYTSDVINNKFPRFVREQRKTLRVIKSFLTINKIELQRRYKKEYAEKCVKEVNLIYQDIQELLLGELDEMVIISRAGKGEVTKAMLLHGRTKEEREEYDENIDQGSKSKLMEKDK